MTLENRNFCKKHIGSLLTIPLVLSIGIIPTVNAAGSAYNGATGLAGTFISIAATSNETNLYSGDLFSSVKKNKFGQAISNRKAWNGNADIGYAYQNATLDTTYTTTIQQNSAKNNAAFSANNAIVDVGISNSVTGTTLGANFSGGFSSTNFDNSISAYLKQKIFSTNKISVGLDYQFNQGRSQVDGEYTDVNKVQSTSISSTNLSLHQIGTTISYQPSKRITLTANPFYATGNASSDLIYAKTKNYIGDKNNTVSMWGIGLQADFTNIFTTSDIVSLGYIRDNVINDKNHVLANQVDGMLVKYRFNINYIKGMTATLGYNLFDTTGNYADGNIQSGSFQLGYQF